MGGWRDMSAEALEEQYSPSRWSPRLGSDAIVQAHLEATAAGTQQARAEARTSLHVPYGDGDREKLDIYFPADPAGTFPLLVYIHGGYWQCLSKDESGFAALPLVSRGVAVAAVGYDTAPTGHMDAMVLQVRRSVAFLVQRHAGIRGIYLCGHSAGAHLAAMVLSTDWTEYGVAPDIKGAESGVGTEGLVSAPGMRCLCCPHQALGAVELREMSGPRWLQHRGCRIWGCTCPLAMWVQRRVLRCMAVRTARAAEPYPPLPLCPGAVLVSGVYDLEPILHTYVNDELNMSQEVAQRNSPMLHITPAAMACQVLVAVAQHDSPEFRRQSQEYGQVSCGQRPAWPCSEAAPALPAWDEELTSCIRAMFLLHVGGCQWQQFTGGCQSLRTVPAVWSGADGSQGPSCQHCSLHRPCVQLAGLFPCWILLVWTTLTSLRSCQRRATSSLR
ncbi:kynurenine formamidase isoform X2 [Colius striatus]|uniref:kynurenine formamidase isoform X2 n=1 Tax=Colius striatus TaxID=57412 RepID=UPI002B1E3E9F|nr:kynurenine formamidase isoform X2 [Colius striatus]